MDKKENYQVKESPANSEHNEVGSKMANDIIDNFNPEQQNEMIALIKEKIASSRSEQIEVTEKKIEGLKMSYKALLEI